MYGIDDNLYQQL